MCCPGCSVGSSGGHEKLQLPKTASHCHRPEGSTRLGLLEGRSKDAGNQTQLPCGLSQGMPSLPATVRP